MAPSGDPTRVSMRVVEIEAILQLEGGFELNTGEFRGGEGAERPPLVPIDSPGTTEAKLHQDVIHAAASFAFMAVSVSEYERTKAGDAGAPTAAFRASALFGIRYRLDGEGPISDDDLLAFAEINVRMNAIPFWREYLHSCLARTGLPPFEIPPFNPMRIARDAAAASRKATNQSIPKTPKRTTSND